MKSDSKTKKVMMGGAIFLGAIGGVSYYFYQEALKNREIQVENAESTREFSNVLSGMSQFRQGLVKYDESKRDLSEYFPSSSLGKAISRLISLRRTHRSQDSEKDRLYKEISENPTEALSAVRSALGKFPSNDIYWAHYEVLQLLKELPVTFEEKREIFIRYLRFPMASGEKISNTLPLFAIDFLAQEIRDSEELKTLVRDSLSDVHTSPLARNSLLSHLSKRNPAEAKVLREELAHPQEVGR